MFGPFKKTVSVNFVDDSTGQTIARSEMPLEQLPDTFALQTDLDIAGQSYIVMRAEPQTKDRFAKTKCLTVTLRKVERVDPKKILFSMPSICNSALPVTEPSGGAESVYVFHEDDWRQCEFISVRYAGEISAELAAIRHVHSAARSGSGWREIHVRDRIVSPLAAGTHWHDVMKHLGRLDPGPRIALGDARHTVSGSVATQFGDGVVVWGVETAGNLSVLCVENVQTASAETIAGLRRVADALSLVLVHWCRCQSFSPGGAALDGAKGAPWDVAAPGA
jgi:hypothetical protein